MSLWMSPFIQILPNTFFKSMRSIAVDHFLWRLIVSVNFQIKALSVEGCHMYIAAKFAGCSFFFLFWNFSSSLDVCADVEYDFLSLDINFSVISLVCWGVLSVFGWLLSLAAYRRSVHEYLVNFVSSISPIRCCLQLTSDRRGLRWLS